MIQSGRGCGSHLVVWSCGRFERVLPYTLGGSRLGRLARRQGMVLCDECRFFEGK